MADTFKGIITADGKKRQLPYGNVLETPVSDTTLSVGGGFADAKIVGGKFAKVNETTDSLKEDLGDTTSLIAKTYKNLVYDYEIDDDTQSRQFIDFVPGNNRKVLYTDLSKKSYTLEKGKKYTLLASATVSGGINGVVLLYVQTISDGNIQDGLAKLHVYSDGQYILTSTFTATTNKVSSFVILANNTQQTGRVVFDSIAIFEGEVSLNKSEAIKDKNTKKYFAYNLPDYLYKNELDNHETRIKALETIVMNDICDLIGDSLTGGAYGAEVIYKYENHLKKLLPNWTMNNYGAGSEKANAISARSGGLEFYINPCTLTTTPTKVEFVDGQYRDFFLTTSTDFYNYYLDDGTKILLTRKTVGDSIVNYAALVSGTKTIKRPTRVYDDFILNDNTSHVAIICIGANGGINSEIDLVAQVKNIIHENGYTRYLVLPENMGDIGQKRDSLLRQNRYLNEEFGKHFVNTYDYMIKYGLSDFNITPTDADNTDISLSIIPESLRCDSIHPNEKGCEITANLLYQRGKELGYW